MAAAPRRAWQYTLTGVDVDRNALAVRQRTARPTDRLLYGDLRSRELFAAEEFDAIFNSFVLEHVDGAERVLDNFLYWLKPGGTLILRIPDGDSVYGFVTRMTPFWFHVLYKKYVQKMPNAGKPGYDPFPVFYDDVVSRRGIHRYCAERGCKVHDRSGLGQLSAEGRSDGRVAVDLRADRLAAVAEQIELAL